MNNFVNIKRLSIVLILFVLTSFASFSQTNSTGNTMGVLPIDLDDFLIKFEESVINQDKIGLISLMDPEYKLVQLDGFYNGNTEQFLNEFFCGNELNGDGFKCILFNEITKVERVKILKGEAQYTIVYKIISKDDEIKADWTITVIAEDENIIYGIYGAVG